MGQLRALLTDFQQLVDLLLVLGKCKTDIGVVDRKYTLGRHRILVQRNRNRTQGLHRQHGGIQTRAIGANHHHVLVAAQAGLVQSGCDMCHQREQFAPGQCLPDTKFLLTHRGRTGPFSGMFQQQSGERCLHGVSFSTRFAPVLTKCLKVCQRTTRAVSLIPNIGLCLTPSCRLNDNSGVMEARDFPRFNTLSNPHRTWLMHVK